MITIKTIQIKEIWQKDKRIQNIRNQINKKIRLSVARSKAKFDTQDLEHQILFRMATDSISLDQAFKEQKYIVQERMKNAEVKPDKLFCFGVLRTGKCLKLVWGKDRKKLYAIDDKKKIEIIFKEITNQKEKDICSDIMQNYHYIHSSRPEGYLYGFYVKGHKLPFAIEQVEPCDLSRNYKKAILMLHDINYHSVCELTRFYSVPNTPKNIIGILDKLVGRDLREKGFEFMMTSVMPAYAKTKSTTIAGGIDTPLYAKELSFEFFKRPDNRYQLCTKREKDKLTNPDIIKTKWKLFPTIEMIKPLVKKLKIDIPKVYSIKK